MSHSRSDLGCKPAIEIDTQNPEYPKLNLDAVLTGRLSTSEYVHRPTRSDRNIDRLTLAAYPVVATREIALGSMVLYFDIWDTRLGSDTPMILMFVSFLLMYPLNHVLLLLPLSFSLDSTPTISPPLPLLLGIGI